MADQSLEQAREHLSLYQRITDKVSYAQGTPGNLTFWLVVIGLWFAFGPELGHATFIPGWASSNAWNFPLNTGTSCMELFIGFLVSASTNRSERHLETTLERMGAQEQRIELVEEGLRSDIAANTALTQEIHRLAQQNAALTQQVHDLVQALGDAGAAPRAGDST